MTRIIVTVEASSGDVFFTMKATDRTAVKEGIFALKQYVPADFRSFDDATKQWRIDATWRVALSDWFGFMQAQYKAVIEWTDAKPNDAPRPRSTPPTSPDAFATLHLLPGAPQTVIKAVYRELCKLHHPDTPNGETAKMQAINEAYERLRFAA